jgi:hypothetical protein
VTGDEIEPKQNEKEPHMRTFRLSLLLIALAGGLAATQARAQDVICCIDIIGVGGDWFGAVRLKNCQEFFNSAATPVLRKLCRERRSLACINTARCNELPPEDNTVHDPPSGGGAALPPSPDRDGLADGFGVPQPAPPPAGGVSPPRLVYLIMGVPGGSKPVKSFTVWLDRNACPLALDQNNRLADSGAAKHVIRGKVIRRDGRVRIEAEAQQRPGGARIGPFRAESEGDDAAAVAKATRALAEKMKLECTR